MNFLLVLAIIAVLLFFLAFITKRRFGILGLALFAGSYLAHTWTSSATPLIEKTGVSLDSLGVPTSAIVGALLTLLPALILLANSPKYSGKWAKVIGSLAFPVLAVILLVPVLQTAFASDATSDTLNSFIVDNYTILMTIGLVGAIIDLFLSRPHHKHAKKHASEH